MIRYGALAYRGIIQAEPAKLLHLRLIHGGLAHHKPEPDERHVNIGRDKSAEFKRWLALFFIEKGKYKITEKGYAELAPPTVRQDTHFGEDTTTKERSTKTEVRRPLTKSEIKEAVARKVEEMIRDGKAEELYNKGHIDRPFHLDWKNKETRIVVIRKLLEFLGASPERLDKLREELYEMILKTAREEPVDTKRMQEILDEIRRSLERIREITADDFKNNGLSGLISHCYNGSPYLALVEAGYAYSEEELIEHAKTGEFKVYKIYPWEMTAPQGFYKKQENRIAAIKWLVWKLKKDPKWVTTDDLEDNGLSGLLDHYCPHSPYLALLEANLVTSADEDYMRSTQHTH